jgi:GNAT superfamily N-acetyltransferase
LDVVVREGQLGDFDAFLRLAAEVEDWFGPMVDDPGFHGAVQRALGAGRTSGLVATALGDDIVGGLIFRHHERPSYEVSWIVVTERCRARGVGRALLGEALRRWVRLPAELTVVTFGPDHPAAAFRRFYERLGFIAAEELDRGPEGRSRQRFRLALDVRLPDWAQEG